MEIVVYVLLAILLTLCIVSVTLTILTGIKQYKHARNMEKSIKELDSVLGDAFKGMQRDQFFREIEELNETENKEGEEENGRE